MIPSSPPWREPLDCLEEALGKEGACVLLYSGAVPGRYSYLAHTPEREITAEDFAPLEAALSEDQPPLANAWFGYLGYPLRHALEAVPDTPPGPIPLPGMWMAKFRTVTAFDHQERVIQESGGWRVASGKQRAQREPRTMHLTSNLTKAEYLVRVEAVLEAIRAGTLYQANLTRKFYGEFEEAPDPLTIFRALCEVSPSPYSAFLRFGDTHVLSSSPERFLTMDAQGNAAAQPIKGSAARDLIDPARDAALREALAGSAKDRAENLMIVDLMRNDFARGSESGSVQVERLFEVTSHPTIHHLSSRILGRRRAEVSPLAFVQNCFPPGSMTGAPKIRAMQLCAELEEVERGPYSGALGWFGGDGSCDLSVIIRTILLRGRRFEFQVGGGIVADSTPEGEWRETLAKARAVALALGISPERLEEL